VVFVLMAFKAAHEKRKVSPRVSRRTDARANARLFAKVSHVSGGGLAS